MGKLIVQKYGGTSVSDPKAIIRVARRIVEYANNGHKLVVVVSAMADTTNELYGLAGEITKIPPPRELDALVTTGERVSTTLMAMAICSLGKKAESFTGSQSGIITEDLHNGAKIVEVTPFRLENAINNGVIPIVAGFQGVSKQKKEISTLGRGGSDTTAVALADALNAEICEIYTDVDGVFSANPQIVPNARQFSVIPYSFMHNMALFGAKVLHPHSVEFGLTNKVPIHTRSSFSWREGTIVGGKEDHTYFVSPTQKYKLPKFSEVLQSGERFVGIASLAFNEFEDLISKKEYRNVLGIQLDDVVAWKNSGKHLKNLSVLSCIFDAKTPITIKEFTKGIKGFENSTILESSAGFHVIVPKQSIDQATIKLHNALYN